MIDAVIVGFIVAGAVAYVVYRYGIKKSGGCGCGCGGKKQRRGCGGGTHLPGSRGCGE